MNCGIYFSGAGNARDMQAQHFWEFPFYRPAILEISTLPLGTVGNPILTPAGREKVAF